MKINFNNFFLHNLIEKPFKQSQFEKNLQKQSVIMKSHVQSFSFRGKEVSFYLSTFN